MKKVFQKPIKKQIMLLFLPVVLAAVLIIGLFAYFFETNNIKKNASILTQSMVSQISILLNDKMMTVFTQMINLSNSPSVNTLLLSEGSAEEDFKSLMACYGSMEEIYRNYDQMVDSLYFCNNRGVEVKYFVNDVPKHIGLSLPQWMKKYNSSPHGVYWLNEHRDEVFQTMVPHKVISVFRLIGSPQSASSGILLFNLNSSYFSTILDNVHVSENGYMMLISKDGTLQSASMQNRYCLTLSAVEKLKEHFGSSGSMALQSVTNQRMLITYQSIDANGWIVAAVMPESDLLSTAGEFKYILLVLVLALTLLVIWLSNVLAKSISKPIEYLSNQVIKFDNGDMSVSFHVDAGNEIGVLAHGLSYLKVTVTELLAQVRREQEQKTKMQLLALQEQIKPHFLYNTIGSIRQLVNMRNNRMASDMCVELARFYRLGISGGKEIVTLEEELDHVASYLEIQKMRYGDDFEYEINVDESLLPTQILKLSLQPLVENAIYHGIKTKDGIGMILVSGKMQEEKIILTVFDDGVGIEPESLVDLRSKLRQPPEINHTKYFGLRNVNTRLKLYFGEESGVVLESVPGVYTQVSLVIPLAKAGEGESFDA